MLAEKKPFKFRTIDFWLKELLGLPFYLSALFISIVQFGGNPIATLAVVLLGWYLYNLFYWKLYCYFILDQERQRKNLFYAALVVINIVISGVIFVYL